MTPEDRFLGIVLADPTVAAVLERAPALGVGDWWLTAGVLFQTVWNAVTGRPPGTGIRDADLVYLDPDPSWHAEDAVIRRGADLFAGLPVPVEIRNQGRVHLWYAGRFGAAPPAPFRDCREAIGAFEATCCAVGVTVDDDGPRLYAPYGLDDLLGLVDRRNPHSSAPGATYEAKVTRWQAVWPELTVLPWR